MTATQPESSQKLDFALRLETPASKLSQVLRRPIELASINGRDLKQGSRMTKEPDKTKIQTPKPSPRKVIIALIPRWKKPTETEKKTSPSGADGERARRMQLALPCLPGLG